MQVIKWPHTKSPGSLINCVCNFEVEINGKTVFQSAQ